MILDRLYIPDPNELIYHYCRPEAFLEIMRTQTVWLSAYYVLNDSAERKWGYSIFLKAANQLQEQVGKQFTDKIKAMIQRAYSQTILMISSYSLDPDVLTQWRAYADDGRGFAIGFSPELIRIPAKPLRVLYDEELQIQELLGNLRHTYEYEKSIGFKYDEEFQSHWYNIGLDLCAYKNPAFREEKEIRFAHVSGLAPEGNSGRIVPAGARDQTGKRLSKPAKIHFRITAGVVVPYVALDYSNKGTILPIKEVILGPRNENADSNIEIFLNTMGMKGIKVRRSNVPYR
jgi:hypothetical protein